MERALRDKGQDWYLGIHFFLFLENDGHGDILTEIRGVFFLEDVFFVHFG